MRACFVAGEPNSFGPRHQNGGANRIERGAMLRAAEGTASVVLDLAPGDAILFDEMLAHTTVTNDRMTEPRYCADAWFFPVSAFPADLYKPFAYAVP